MPHHIMPFEMKWYDIWYSVIQFTWVGAWNVFPGTDGSTHQIWFETHITWNNMEWYLLILQHMIWYDMIWYDMMWHIESFNNPKWCSHYKLISSAKLVKILLRNWISENQWTSFLTLHHSHKMNIKNRRWKWEKTNYVDYKDKVV